MKMRDVRLRARHPQTTVRWRLTLIYGGLFLVCGAGLLAVTYALVARSLTPTALTGPRTGYCARVTVPAGAVAHADGNVAIRPAPNSGVVVNGRGSAFPPFTKGGSPCQIAVPKNAPAAIQRLLRTSAGDQVAGFVRRTQQGTDLHRLEIESGVALAIMAIISGLLGWLVAGRVLRPLRTISDTAQRISEANLHERLAMPGPRDELRKLADTIDGLLARLEGAFAAQRRFVANASHELRTPLTATRALLEMVLSDPKATLATFRESCRHALEESEQQERLIDSLLALAHGQRGIDRRQPVELAGLARDVLAAGEGAATERGVALEASLQPTVISGDAPLIERLVANLVDNAIRHNIDGGHVHVEVRMSGGRAMLTVANSGPLVAPGDVDRLRQPFQRATPERLGRSDGIGLGLSIVDAIAAAHGAALAIRARSDGGLAVEVSFQDGLAVNRRDVPITRPLASSASTANAR